MSDMPNLVTIPCQDCGRLFQVMDYLVNVKNLCHSCKVRTGHTLTEKPSIQLEREQVIKEIQAFASDYAHQMTQDGVTRDVLIIEQLIDFLKVPEGDQR